MQRNTQNTKIIASAGVSLLVIRAAITVMGSWFPHTVLWQRISTDRIEHYQLGLLLMVTSVVLGRLKRSPYRRFLPVIFGSGIGLVIDETNQLLSYLGVPYTPLGTLDWSLAAGVYGLLVVYYCYGTSRELNPRAT